MVGFKLVCLSACVIGGVLIASAIAEEEQKPSEQSAKPSLYRKALDAPLPAEGLSFQGATLDEIAKQLSKLYGIRVLVERDELKNLGLDEDDTYTFAQRKGTLGKTLRQGLRQADLSYMAVKDALLITSIDKVLETSGIKPVQMGDVVLPLQRSALPTPVFYAEPQPNRKTQIRKVLRQPLHRPGLLFDATPLGEVVEHLRSEYDIEIYVDLHALDDLGLSLDDRVTIDLRHVSLGAALRIMLRELDLTYFTDGELLTITTEEVALTRLTLAVYPVGDILQPKEVGGPATDGKKVQPEGIDVLLDLIISMVASDTWISNGGPEAEITVIQPGLLVVSQTQDVHEQIQQLLAALRRAKQHEFAVLHQSSPIKKKRNVRGGGGGFGGGGGGGGFGGGGSF